MGRLSTFFHKRKGPRHRKTEERWCYEREKQRGKGKQEGGTEKPQREEKDEEGEEKQVGWTAKGRLGVGGDVLKLFKKTLSLNGSSPSFTIERRNECSCVVSILGLAPGWRK